jgi:hypothetical protein
MDWREAFKKYINIVGMNEGVTFLHPEDWGDDWPEIEAARDESDT